MDKDRGNALATYSILIAVIAVVLIPVFMQLGGTVVNCLTEFHDVFAEGNALRANAKQTTSDSSSLLSDNKSNSKSSASASTSSSSSSTSEDSSTSVIASASGNATATASAFSSGKSVYKNCSSSACSISFGDVTLKGIPSNMGDFIETAGIAGGTEKIASILEQINKQVEKDPNLSDFDKQLIDLLANRAYSMAYEEANAETVASQNSHLFESYFTQIDPAKLATMSSNFEKDAYIQSVMREYQDQTSQDAYYDIASNIQKVTSTMKAPDIMIQQYETHKLFSGEPSLPKDFGDRPDAIRTEFEILKHAIKKDSGLNKELKDLVLALANDVSSMADVISAAFEDNQYPVGTPIIDYTNMSTIENSLREFHGIVLYDEVAGANEGMTSKNTHTDAVLIDVSHDNTQDAAPTQ